MSKDLIVVKCPKCGREYLPTEIYLPNVFFGQPKNIVRDLDNKIILVDDNMNLVEEYICDDCNTKFKVTANVSFKTDIVKDDFENEYVSELYQNERYSLEEN